jgi:hypothetical protein
MRRRVEAQGHWGNGGFVILDFIFDVGVELVFEVCGMMLCELHEGVVNLKPKRNSTGSATLQLAR